MVASEQTFVTHRPPADLLLLSDFWLDIGSSLRLRGDKLSVMAVCRRGGGICDCRAGPMVLLAVPQSRDLAQNSHNEINEAEGCR